MRKFFLYLVFALPVFSSGEVESLRAILEEDLKVHIQINELKKEQKILDVEMSLAMQNARALISAYEQKTEELISKNKEENFKINTILSKINSLEENILKLEQNTKKAYDEFKGKLSKIPPALQSLYREEMLEIENISYPNSSEEALAKLKFLNKVALDTNGYRFLDENTVAFGLNAEFGRVGAKGDLAKLFKILDGESGYEVLNLEIDKGAK